MVPVRCLLMIAIEIDKNKSGGRVESAGWVMGEGGGLVGQKAASDVCRFYHDTRDILVFQAVYAEHGLKLEEAYVQPEWTESECSRGYHGVRN